MNVLAKANKAWVAAAVSFLSLTAMTFFGFELDPTLQAGIVAVVTAALTWLVPNAP